MIFPITVPRTFLRVLINSEYFLTLCTHSSTISWTQRVTRAWYKIWSITQGHLCFLVLSLEVWCECVVVNDLCLRPHYSEKILPPAKRLFAAWLLLDQRPAEVYEKTLVFLGGKNYISPVKNELCLTVLCTEQLQDCMLRLIFTDGQICSW